MFDKIYKGANVNLDTSLQRVRPAESQITKGEGMPSNEEVMSKLVRQKPLTKEEWIYLIEKRRASIAPFLCKITLKKLGEQRWDDVYTSSLGEFLKENDVYTGELLNIQGFFERLKTQKFKFSTQETERFFGLSRNNEWFYIRLIYLNYHKPYRIRLFVKKIKSTELLLFRTRLEPRELWYSLSYFFGSVIKERKNLLDQMQEVCKDMANENKTMALIPKDS